MVAVPLTIVPAVPRARSARIFCGYSFRLGCRLVSTLRTRANRQQSPDKTEAPAHGNDGPGLTVWDREGSLSFIQKRGEGLPRAMGREEWPGGDQRRMLRIYIGREPRCAGWCGAIGEPTQWGDIRRIGNLFKVLVRFTYSIVTCTLDDVFVAAFTPIFSSLLSMYMQSVCQFMVADAKSFAFKERFRSTADNSLIPEGIGKVSGLNDVSIGVARTGLGYF